MTASAYAFSASRYAFTSGFCLSRSQNQSSTSVSPWISVTFGAFFATGGFTPRSFPRRGDERNEEEREGDRSKRTHARRIDPERGQVLIFHYSLPLE